MEKNMRVMCSENDELAEYLLLKRQELANNPKGLKENTDMTLAKAYNNICNAQYPIKTLKDLKYIKCWKMDAGAYAWLFRQWFWKFRTIKRKRRYLPQKNSVAYALLISLYRETADGNEFMHKQDLIDAAEASGLSREPIASAHQPVVDLYPTLVFLARAYSLLEGDVCAQEEMLRKQSNSVVSSVFGTFLFGLPHIICGGRYSDCDLKT